MTPTRRPRGSRLSGRGAAGGRRGRSSRLLVPEERMVPSLELPGEGSSQHTQRPRGRLPPFSEEENQVLVASYLQRHTQIRGLGISRVSAPERERLWEQIAVAVSAVGGRARRTADKVQKHLNDLVGRLRKLLGTWARRGYVTRQGVAPSHLSQLREYQRQLLDIMSLETVVGTDSRDDTDDIQHAQSPVSSPPGSPSDQQQPQEPPTQTDQVPPATHQQEEEEAAAPSTFPLQRTQEEDLEPQLIMAAAGVGDDTASNVEAFQDNAAASADLPPQVPTLDAAESAPLPPGRRQLIELGESLAAQVDRLWEQGRPSTQMNYVERTLQLLQQDLGQQARDRQQLKEQLQRMDQNQALQRLMLTTAINNQTGVLRQSREEIRALRLAVQQLNATIARCSHSREEEGVVLLQDERVARPGTESHGVADSELPPVDPPSQLVTLPTSSHAPTDPNTQTHHSDPSHHTASPCSHSSNMPPPDQPTSTRIVPTSTPLFSLPSATHTSSHAQPDLSPSTFTTPLRESPNPQIRSVPAQNVIPSTLPLFSLPINLAPQSFNYLPSFTFFTSLNHLLPQSTSHTFPTPQAQPLSSNPLQQLAIQLPQQQQMAMLQQQQQEQMALLLQQQQEQMAMLLEPRQEPQQPH